MKAKRVVVEEMISITMPLKDAQDLRAIAGHIGGDPKGPRGAVDRLAEALRLARVSKSEVRQEHNRPNYFEYGRTY